jgi:hypothetical protein
MLNECGVDKAVSRKYVVRILIVVATYLALGYGSVHWLQRHPPAPGRYLIAVLPVVPMLVIPVFVVQVLRNLDELQRRIQLESLGFSFAATALISLTYGFLENAGLPHLSWILVWPLMSAFWIVGLFAARWRYR